MIELTTLILHLLLVPPYTNQATTGILYDPTSRNVRPNGLNQINNTNYSTNLDGGTWGRDLSVRLKDFINIKDAPYSATGLGIADDSTAITAAMNALAPLGGTIYFPSGKYKFNVLVTNQNIKFQGDSNIKDYSLPLNTAYFRAFNSSVDCIKVGNDSGVVKGFRMNNITMQGNDAACAGINFGGGAFECFLNNVTVWGFKTNLIFKGGANFPCSLIFIDNFTLQASPQSVSKSIYAFMPANQVSYTTGIFFSNGHVNGMNTSGALTVHVDGTQLNFSNTYFDLDGSGHGIRLDKTQAGVPDPWINFVNCVLDTPNSTNILIFPNINLRDISYFIRGSVQINGLAQLPNGTLLDCKGQTQWIPFQSRASFLGVSGELSLLDINTMPGYYTNTVREYNSSDTYTLENRAGSARFFVDQGFIFYPTNGGTIFNGGVAGSFTLAGANFFMDNGRSLWFRDSGNVYRSTLGSVAGTDNMILSSRGSMNINPTTTLNLNPTVSTIATGGSDGAFNLQAADLYLDNSRSILWKDAGGVSRVMLNLDPNNQFFIENTAGSNLVFKAVTNGLIQIFTGNGGGSGHKSYEIDTNGTMKSFGTNGIGIPSQMLSFLYASNLFNTTGNVQTSIDNLGTNTTTIALSDYVTPLAAGANKAYWRAPYALTLKNVRASLLTASTSAGPVTVNIKKNGTTIFSTKLTIDDNELTSVTAAVPFVFSVTSIADDDNITFDLDTAGSTTPTGLEVKLFYTR